MGLFDGFDAKIQKQAREELAMILPDGEEIEKVYIVKEDFCAFTSKRVVLIDKKLIGSKKSLTAIPYSKINFVALKRGGMFTISKEVIIGTSGAQLEVDTYDTAQAYEIMKKISGKIA
ncbi:MAG: PH domain-containing protein [Lentimicrobium sp.]|jgi:hypothetical protein|nr:PH domain-containing protein [Lentimicrobium sp.]